jgi:hypothetical protein
MRRFFQSQAIGGPQFVAAALLFVYLLQCLWLVHLQTRHASDADSGQALRIHLGLQQWHGGAVAGTPESLPSEAATVAPSAERSGHLRLRDGFDEDRSPLYYLTAAAPFLLRPASWTAGQPLWQLLAAAPYLFFGVMLGGSLWYVTRRLYGNAGGFIALLLYCFSPAMIVSAAGAQSLAEVGAVWGAFGAVWTGIAVAHTLYAAREVVLWNWRRILLLGLSVALAAGNQFSLGLLAVVTLLKRAVVVIWSAACVVALVIVAASYFFRLSTMWHAMMHARWLDFEPPAFAVAVSYMHNLQTIFRGSPALLLILPVALAAFASWRRARYFGNAAPLLIAGLLLALAVGAPDFPGEGFRLAALLFLWVFVAGVFADLLETRRGLLVMAALGGLLIASAVWNLLALARAAGS